MTLITPDTVVASVIPQDIGADLFMQVLAEAGSPAWSSSLAAWGALAGLDVSIAFCLAVFHHESTYATNPAAIVVIHDTMNPGNCRSSRTGDFPVISTARGPFVDYPSWVQGWVDLSFRLTDPSYVYVKEGRRTIRQIIERFAPATDNNTPDAYIAAVVADMNRWIGAGSMPEQIEGFAWVQDTTEYGYPKGTHGRNGVAIDRLIMHCTLGTDSLAWLTGSNGNSVHFLDWPDGRARVQMVLLSDASWGAGNRGYNLRGINYEHEATAAEMLNPSYWTDSIIGRMGHNAANIIRKNPGILPDREHVIGHADVPDQDHTDPGRFFPWGRFLDAINRDLGAGVEQPAEALLIEGNPYGEVPVIAGFKDYVVNLGQARYARDLNAGILSVFGYPQAPEYRASDGCSYQLFERQVLQWTPHVESPWDIVPLRRDDAPPA